MKYKQLKVGQAFTFEPDGAVFVRCRGGFRYSFGGPLYNRLIDGFPIDFVEVYLWDADLVYELHLKCRCDVATVEENSK